MGGNKEMGYKIKNIIKVIEDFAPLDTQASYDNSGLILGDITKEITGVLITLDTNVDVVNEAINKGCNLIIEHHPSIFEPIKGLDYRFPLHKAMVKAIKNDITIYAAHTNIDFAENGLNDYVAKKLLLKNIYCLNNDMSSARIGELEEPLTMKAYAEEIKKVLCDKNIITIGEEGNKVKKVAVINGAGGGDKSLLISLQEEGVDIFVTADIKYSFARFAKDLNYGIISFGHYDSELGFIDIIEKLIKKENMDINVYKTEKCSNPYNIRR